MGRLDDKVVVVTGASRGTGLHLARAFASEGADVVMLSRNEDRLRAAAQTVGPRATAIPTDVGDPVAVRSAFAEIERRWDRVDLLVNNAAIAWPHRVEHATDDELTSEVSTNLLGPLFTARSAIPLLRRSTAGHIVNISSESSHDPFPYLVVYAATKAALEILSTGLLMELRGEGIRVTLLKLGRTAEGEFRSDWDDDTRLEAERTWDAMGYRARVSGSSPQSADRMVEAVLFVVEQPPDSMIDVIHVRSRS